MVAAALGHPEPQTDLEDLLQPDRLAGGGRPERRVVFCGISWKRYRVLDRVFGADRPSPRLYYLDEELELMTTSKEHERLKEWIGGLLEVYFEEAGLEVAPRGQATIRDPLRKAGAEPDKSWCIGREKELPDLVLEIALTSGGIDKLELYRRLHVAEVWFWRRDKLEIFVLGGSRRYQPSRTSRLLPGLDTALLQRCMAMESWQQARRVFRASMRKAGP